MTDRRDGDVIRQDPALEYTAPGHLKTTGRKQAAGATKFRPGISGNPRGRPRGARNKATQEVRDLARRLVEDPEYKAALKARLLNGQSGPIESLLWQYAYGKPKDAVEPGTGERRIVYKMTFDDGDSDE